MAKQYKNNIFEVLKHLDNKDYGYYESLSEEQQKEIQPYTLARWMSAIYGNESSHQSLNKRVNERVNKRFWELSKYKDLQWKLLCSVGNKISYKHQWIGFTKSSNDKTTNMLRHFYSYLNDDEFNLKMKTLQKDDIKEIKQYLGEEDKEKKR